MQLDSVRALKQSLRDALPEQIPARARALAVPGRGVTAFSAGARPATIAVGISPTGKGDFALAVRVQSRALEDGPQVEAIRRKAKGEVDVRYVGSIKKRALPWYQQKQRPLRSRTSTATRPSSSPPSSRASVSGS